MSRCERRLDLDLAYWPLASAYQRHTPDHSVVYFAQSLIGTVISG